MLSRYGDIQVDDKDVLYVHRDNGILTVKLRNSQEVSCKDPQSLRSFGRGNLGETVVWYAIAEAIAGCPTLDMSQPMGLHREKEIPAKKSSWDGILPVKP